MALLANSCAYLKEGRGLLRRSEVWPKYHQFFFKFYLKTNLWTEMHNLQLKLWDKAFIILFVILRRFYGAEL